MPLPRRGGAGGPGRGGGGGRAGAGEPGGGREPGAEGSGRPGSGPQQPGAHGEARRTRCTHPLLLPAADSHRGGGRGAVPEFGRLPGSQQAPGEPAGPLAGHRPSRARSARPAALAGADLLYPPPFRKRNSEPPPAPPPRAFLALLARGGFFSLTPPTPCAPPKPRDDFPNSALLRARAANSAGGPDPAVAPLEWGPRDARGAAPARANPRPQPATRDCARSPQDRRVAGEGRGAAAAAGLRAGPAHRPRAHLEAPCGAGALAAFAGFAPTFRGWREGAGRAQFALPALESDQRLINGLVAGISAASPEPGFQSLLCPKSSLRALE